MVQKDLERKLDIAGTALVGLYWGQCTNLLPDGLQLTRYKHQPANKVRPVDTLLEKVRLHGNHLYYYGLPLDTEIMLRTIHQQQMPLAPTARYTSPQYDPVQIAKKFEDASLESWCQFKLFRKNSRHLEDWTTK
ncbi:uncharacterized protein AB675_12147 [Cyphellophora attinorum]|uniref:Uncharacterized protein n=1 Tax=Cyphellophora attinorum TaxID=1664694 RepID=A0A0N1H8Q1_9EURO|nr:uncharacterized protein AB675_12147 [Phialophora attinorum]KPI38362.1 hypothetical protein AB675_12147 [Phialophora attinorum]